MRQIFIVLLLSLLGANCTSLHKRSQQPIKNTQAIEASYLSGYKKLSFYDAQRSKNIDVYAWYPVEESKAWLSPQGPYPWGRIRENAEIKDPRVTRPLIIFSHGFGTSPEQYAWLVEPLVAAGYVVITTQHADFPGPQINHWNRPLDISFMLTRFLESPLGKHINQNKVGFAGFSLGGMTGISLAGARMSNIKGVVPTKRHVLEKRIIDDASAGLPTWDPERMKEDYRDNRIKAAFLMAPAWSWVFKKSDLQNIHIPVLIVAGDSEEVLVSETNGFWYANNIPKAEFRWIKGAGHFVFLGTPSCEGRAQVDPHHKWPFLYKDPKGVNRQLVHEQVEKLAIAFFDLNL